MMVSTLHFDSGPCRSVAFSYSRGCCFLATGSSDGRGRVALLDPSTGSVVRSRSLFSAESTWSRDLGLQMDGVETTVSDVTHVRFVTREGQGSGG